MNMKTHESIPLFRSILFALGAGCFCSLAWGGAVEADGDLYLFGDKTATPPVTFVTNLVGGTLEARHLYLATTEGSADLLASGGASIVLTGNFSLGYATNEFAGVRSHLALTNATLDCNEFYTNWKGEFVSGVDQADNARMTVGLGPEGVIDCKRLTHMGGPFARIDFCGGRIKIKDVYSSDGIFVPQASDWRSGWPNAGATFNALTGPIDIELNEERTLVKGWGARYADFTGSQGFVKRGTGTLIWGWKTTSNDSYLKGSAHYTGDTVVKAGGIRLMTPSSASGQQAKNDTPAGSSLVLESGTFFDLNGCAATFLGVSGAGMVTNSIATVGTMTLGGSDGDGVFSPEHLGGAFDLVKAGRGTLSVGVPSVPGKLIVSNGLAVLTRDFAAKGIEMSADANLDVRGIALKCRQLACGAGAILTADGGTTFSAGSSITGAKLTQDVSSGRAENALSFGAGAELRKTGAGTLNLTGRVEGGSLTVEEGTVTVRPRPRGYRHYRFKVDARRYNNADVMQLSEFRLFCGEEDVTGLRSGFFAPNVVIRPEPNYTAYSSAETPDKAVDGKTSTKWCDFRGSAARFPTEGDELYIQLDYAEPIYVTGYDWATANDSYSRDPGGWRLLASDDGESWDVLDMRTNVSVTQDRMVWTGPYDVTYPQDRATDVAFDRITLEAGATLDLRGVAMTCTSIVNRGGTVLTDEDKPVVLTAEAGTEVRVGPVEGATFEGDLVKTGTGTNTFVGPYPIVGTFAVTEGTVRALAETFGGAYFRLSVYSNFNGQNVTQFGEFILLDRDGVRLNGGTYAVKPAGTDASTLQEQEAAALWSFKTGNGEGIEKAFDGVFSKFCTTDAPSDGKPIGFVFRIPDAATRVVGYTFVAGNDSGGGRNPKHWKLEGSMDGESWITLDDHVETKQTYGNSTADNPVYFNDGVPYELTNKGPFDPSADKACVFGADAVVRIEDGATLDFTSAWMSLAALEVDVDAPGGTITRFTPCAGGTLALVGERPASELVGAPLVTVGEMRLPGLLKKWAVTVNGVQDLTVRPVWREGALTLEPVPGCMLILR